MSNTTDTRIVGYEPLLSPAALFHELPLGDTRSQTVEATRAEVRAVLDGADDRLLVVTGPCSVHDPKAALDYAARLADLRARYADDLLIVMRVYFEKPRTVTGWKGLINDRAWTAPTMCTAACGPPATCCSTSCPRACRSAASGLTRLPRSTLPTR
jgi:3-deoxy-7-phosphoheptulonate synthase